MVIYHTGWFGNSLLVLFYQVVSVYYLCDAIVFYHHN